MLPVISRTRRRSQQSEIGAARLTTWRSAGACGVADLDFFFVPDGVSGQERTRRENVAKKICAGCGVRSECLRYAVVSGERFGVWGGLTESERSHLKIA